MKKKRIHLVCNAHLDPVWLWQWEDGLTETLSTYRIAAEFCEQNPGFVFNHNEALLYQWVEEHDPVLFKRIQRLVKSKQWHIAGGAYVQPDVNNASGESHIRQYLYSLHYFKDKFGVRPRTAYNFDPFGHAEGFQQILAGCGMDSYIFCRPDHGTYELPVGAFKWEDRSGKSVLARRSDDHYLTNGKIAEQLDRWLPHYADEPESMILWGIGNHGGGPSRAEYQKLRKYVKDHPESEFVESTPEQFFSQIRRLQKEFPTVKGEIEKSLVGCYTSMSRIKRGHREAESQINAVERLAALAWWQGIADYPAEELFAAWQNILFCEFHDILPGTSIPSAEVDCLGLLAHAKENLRRLRVKTLLKVVQDERRAKDGAVPIFICNPHGFRVQTQVELEYHTGHMSHGPVSVQLHCNGKAYPFQRIKTECNIDGNWRVRLAVEVDLKPWEVLRLDATSREVKSSARPPLPKVSARTLAFTLKEFSMAINPRTGLLDKLVLKGQKRSLIKSGSFRPVLFKDSDNSWTCGDLTRGRNSGEWLKAIPWRKPDKAFRLAKADEVARVFPLPADKWQQTEQSRRPVRIIEDGGIRTVVEALFVCERSTIVRHYIMGRKDGRLEIRDQIHYAHADHMLKLEVPLTLSPECGISEALYSAVSREATKDCEEMTNQRWVATKFSNSSYLGVANTGCFAHNLTRKALYLNVMRSPAYSSFNIRPQDSWNGGRSIPRHDQGEHAVSYEIICGRKFSEQRLSQAAQILNIPPNYQVFYPSGTGKASQRAAFANLVKVDKRNVQIVCVKKAERGNALIVRLQELAGKQTKCKLAVKPFRRAIPADLSAYELKTYRIQKGRILKYKEINLVEGI